MIRFLAVLDSAELDSAVLVAAVSGWKYTPTLVAGIPTPIGMTLTVNFKVS